MKWAWAWAVGGAIGLLASCGGKSESDSGAGGSAGVGGVGGSAGVGSTAGSGGVPQDSGVDVAPPDAPPPPGQNILFEVSFENYAWGKKLKGIFITVDGSVWSYDFFANDAGGMPPAVVYPATETEIRARYGPAPLKIGSILPNVVLEQFAWVPSTAGGVLLRQMSCADAGDVTSIGYLFDEATARYTPVILGRGGDQSAKNTAPKADDLVAWLAQYANLPVPCAFNGEACTGATCPTPAPTCPKGQLPSVAGGCWSKCVSLDHCLAVTDCSQCPGGTVCATGADSSVHCLQSVCASTDACTCPFTPPCAGGPAFCTSTGPMRVTCGP
ncbi:MAG: hypothetical protein IT375_17875 [Polyangiaceae bacterium]|nr:hypothetical protein [Polyangiaceae bacterium]